MVDRWLNATGYALAYSYAFDNLPRVDQSDTVNDLLPAPAVAEYLGVHPGTLARWRLSSRGPAWIEIEGQCRYRRSDVEKWLTENTKNGDANR